jgi:quercetin dioxygenase-like cupin family protein
MRTLITGVDAQGKSCVVSWDNLTMDTIGTTFAICVPHAVTSPLPARPVGTADLIDQHLAAGDIRWMVIDYGPDAETPMHHTDTLDLETVLTGKVDLILDDGVHHLEQGDMVVMSGVDHAWKAGPDGCRLNAILVGTPEPGSVQG